MRISDFWRLMEEEFGSARARLIGEQQSLTGLGSVTARSALAAGTDPRRVWLAVCEEMAVPPERRWGRDRPLRRD